MSHSGHRRAARANSDGSTSYAYFRAYDAILFIAIHCSGLQIAVVHCAQSGALMQRGWTECPHEQRGGMYSFGMKPEGNLDFLGNSSKAGKISIDSCRKASPVLV